MKIEKKYIIEICNLSHPDFGAFAKHLDSLSQGKTYIEVPQPNIVHVCDECARPLWMEKTACLYCLGKKDGEKYGRESEMKQAKKNPLLDHKCIFTTEDKPHCINCGVYKIWLENPSKQP